MLPWKALLSGDTCVLRQDNRTEGDLLVFIALYITNGLSWQQRACRKIISTMPSLHTRGTRITRAQLSALKLRTQLCLTELWNLSALQCLVWHPDLLNMPARLGRAILDYCTETLALCRLRDTSVKMYKASRYNIASFGSICLECPLRTHPSLTDTWYIVPIYVSCVHVQGTIHQRCFDRTSIFDVVDACLISLSSESHVPAISEQSWIMRPKFL